MTTLTEPFNEDDLIDTDEWVRDHDGARMRIDIYRLPGAILQRMSVNGQCVQATRSPRPYVLGQACDGTIDDCVFALFFDFCLTHRLDPANLYRQAYSDREPSGPSERQAITARALAQGVEIPKVWDQKAFQCLLDSLAEINNHSLVAVLADLPPF